MKEGKPAPLLLINELLEYADKCAREVKRARLAASQIARAWANEQNHGDSYGERRNFNWKLGLKLWMQRVPAVEIAGRLGCTRRAVHDAAKRYRWPLQKDIRLDFAKAPRIMIGDETLR